MSKYYTLLVRHEFDAPWSIEYGSYHRSEVVEELQVYREDYDIHATCLKIITTAPEQASINAEVNWQNEKLVSAGVIGDFNPLPV